MISLFSRSGNLLQNASFESDLTFWHADNVTSVDTSPAEGTQAASLGPGVASLYQDVVLGPLQRNPLFLSFIAYVAAGAPGELVAEVLWLDASGIVIGNGLRAFIPGTTLSTAHITFFDITDRPPLGTQWARLQFSKGTPSVAVLLDLVNLAPVQTTNLVRNPSFERGLADWSAAGFDSGFTLPFEGAANAVQSVTPGTLSQDVPIQPVLPGSSYLLSFAALAPVNSTVTAQLLWLNIFGTVIGEPAINAPIVATTLSGQGAYMNFLQSSGPAPIGAVKARLVFTATSGTGSTLNLDQVNLIRLTSPNLLENPGFINKLDDWTTQGVAAQGTGGFVGENFALLSGAGAIINQKVVLPLGSARDSFLFGFALRFSGSDAVNGNVLAQVHWLNIFGAEIGLGLALVISQPLQIRAQWQLFTGFTEQAPLDAVSARIQFTKSASSGTGADIGLDSVIFARID
jgi:hypothetical protein